MFGIISHFVDFYEWFVEEDLWPSDGIESMEESTRSFFCCYWDTIRSCSCWNLDLSNNSFDFEVKELKLGGGEALFTDSGETIDSIEMSYWFHKILEHLARRDLLRLTTLLNLSFGV